MQTNNQPENIHHDRRVGQAGEEYERLLKQPLPRRAKGFPYPYILVFMQMPVMIFVIVATVVSNLLKTSAEILVFLFLIWLFIFVIPYRFYSLTKRTTRNAFRKFPVLKATARRLNEPGSRFLPHATILKVEGQDLFLLHYGFVRWWVATEPGEGSGEINGVALVNGQGQVIENTDLLGKAYPTHILSLLGGEDSQVSDNRKRSWNLQTLRHTLPRAEKRLKRWAKEFHANGMSQAYEQLVCNLPALYQALHIGISIYSGHDKWRKARGWSFGLECLYEDALEYQKMCRAYSHFMAAAYGDQLVEIINRAGQLLHAVSAADRWRGRKHAQWALSMLVVIPKAIQTWIYTYGVLGKPGPEQLEWYRRKLARAREVGLQIVQR